MQTMKQTTFDISQIAKIVLDRAGLRLSDTQIVDLDRLLQSDDFSSLQPDLHALPALLQRQSTESPVWQAILRCITVGETYFFRHQAQWDALRDSVLPALIKYRRERGQLHLRLWSAGCATGEEPYSLAMLLREILPDIDQWQITILATDINGGNLERAQKGVFRAWSFRNETPSHVATRWFKQERQNFKLDPVIQRMVIFKPLNLISDKYPSFETGTMNMDLIICRNVTIYFAQDTTRQIAERFHGALNSDGWLMVGHSEPMSSVYQGFAARNFPNTVIYQKIGVTEAAEAPATIELAPLPPVQVKVKHRIMASTPASIIKKTEPLPTAQVKAREYWDRAKQAADAEHWDKALTWLSRAESIDQFQPQVYYLRALIHWQLGEIEDAFRSLRQSVYCDPNFALAHYALAELYEAGHEFKQSLRHLRLAQSAIEGLPPQIELPFADELTVEMFRSLLNQKLQQR
jgi:chemotaxis protein methyltransferase CheR